MANSSLEKKEGGRCGWHAIIIGRVFISNNLSLLEKPESGEESVTKESKEAMAEFHTALV